MMIDVIDSTRHLVRWTRDNARQEQRLKPDHETNPSAELDCEKELSTVEQPRRAYSSTSVYVRLIVNMPSASDCSPRLLHRRVSITAISAIRTLHATQS